MTTEDLYCTVDGKPCSYARITVAYAGPWQAECTLEFLDPLPSPVTIRIGDLALVGTAIADADGTDNLKRRVRIVAGAGGWSRAIAPRAYHNDAGVRARVVADDAARDVGETIGAVFVPARERIGLDYARSAGLASRALTDVIGAGVAWWLDYDGTTCVGPRPVGAPADDTYTVLAFDPSERIATIHADDPSIIRVGQLLTQGLDTPATVRELQIIADAKAEREVMITAWLGGTAQDAGRLQGLFTAIVQRIMADKLYGPYKYRVASQGSDDRCGLQAISAGVPDLTMITGWPGIPGERSRLTLGTQVLVQFIDGDRAQPVITHYSPVGFPGFAPIALTLGGPTGPAAAREGDSVAVTLASFQFSGTISGLGAVTGTITPNAAPLGNNKATGTITSGSSIVNIAPPIPPTP